MQIRASTYDGKIYLSSKDGLLVVPERGQKVFSMVTKPDSVVQKSKAKSEDLPNVRSEVRANIDQSR